MTTNRKGEVLYFAHCLNVYDTPYEEAAIKLIKHCFPGAEVENPNQPKHQKGYSDYQARTAKNRDDHKGMDYFYDVVLPGCTGCVSMPFLDSRFGLGVAGETQKTFRANKPAYGMYPTRDNITQEDLDEWVRNPLNGLFAIRPFNDSEKAEFLATSKEGSALVVSHHETRLRTWSKVYGKEPKRPFVEAHLVKMPIPEGFYPPEKK